MKQIFKTLAIISKVTTMSDGGIRVQADTNEVTPEVAATLMGFHKKFGTLAFVLENTPIEEKDLELPAEQKEFPNQKSLSERLRNVIYVLWEKKGSQGDFEDYRRKYMEKLIELTKQKIDEN